MSSNGNNNDKYYYKYYYLEVANVANMNINDIWRELKNRGLSSDGKKTELIK